MLHSIRNVKLVKCDFSQCLLPLLVPFNVSTTRVKFTFFKDGSRRFRGHCKMTRLDGDGCRADDGWKNVDF